HESSFHLEPRYSSFSPEGRETISDKNTSPQPVMYFLGYARTPLALPMVSNLSTALRGDEAAYTVQLGILPLPKVAGDRSDSVTLYVIIQRSIESNRSENVVNIERYAKEFTIREGEPVQLKLENAPPERNAYIIQLEDNSILHFYEDFARYFTEHIWINTERLKFGLGKAEMSRVTSRLSIPFTVAQASKVQVELLSVIDSAPSLKIVDTVQSPADYLAEADMRPMANGPYKYRFTARDLMTDKVLFTETHNFVKSAPIMVPSPQSLATADTLQVGGKREDLRKLLSDMQYSLALRDAETERLDKTLADRTAKLRELEEEYKANQEASIAGLRTRFGLGYGIAAGSNIFLGMESKEPKLAFDVSFGVLSNAPPFVSTVGAANLSKRIENPKSLGLQLTYVFLKPAGDWLQAMAGIGYYGVWSTNPQPGGIRSATILAPTIGFNNEFGGETGKYGMSVTGGFNIGLGSEKTMLGEFGVKLYKRF
ncbi:MAG TPA: hypothetical protein VFH43_09945, partial [Candidatus Kapabacteria bacterium]|nr:hypothetical protein [Candidatus Kapabacteria bacterium]